MPQRPAAPKIRFGSFEFDPSTLELCDGARDVPLARQPALVLQTLLERPGELVTREEITELLWPDGTHVEVELGINNAVRRLRRALGDSAQDPSYVETLTGLGYRWCGPPEPPEEAESNLTKTESPDAIPDSDGSPDGSSASKARTTPASGGATADSHDDWFRSPLGLALAAALLLALAAVAVVSGGFHRPKASALEQAVGKTEGRPIFVLKDVVVKEVETWKVAPEALGVEAVGGPADEAPMPGRESYLGARYLLSRVPTEKIGESEQLAEHVNRAVELLEQSLADDSDYAPAWVALARAHFWSSLWRPPVDWGPEASAAALRALELEPWNGGAHAALAEVFLGAHYDIDKARKHGDLAVSLDPNDPWARLARAKVLAATGDFPSALAAAERARQLDPENDLAAMTTAFLRFLAGRFEDSRDLTVELLAVRPDETGLLLQTIRIAQLLEDEAGAIAAADRFARVYRPEFAGYQRLDDFWEDLMGPLPDPEYPISTHSWIRAVAAVSLGRRDRASQILLEGCRGRAANVLVFAPVDPQLGTLRGEPAFEELLRCLGTGTAGYHPAMAVN